MNYYPFHIGDFVAHTSHLSWEEDIAYRRMLDAYYLREKSLPVSIDDVCRLIRMRDSKEAVGSVLKEFFILSDDGWHNKRADEELTEMKTKQDERATKDEHEADRMRRHRERRSEMFVALRNVGVVPAWDVSIKELQRLYDVNNCNAPATHLQREQVETCNAPATAIPTPTPTPTPVLKNTSAIAPPDGVSASVWVDFCQLRKDKKAKLTQTAIDGIASEAGKAGWALDAVLRECCARGWTGFKAAWVIEKRIQAPAAAQSFRERDIEIGRSRWEEMTGETHPDKQAKVIDIKPTFLERLA